MLRWLAGLPEELVAERHGRVWMQGFLQPCERRGGASRSRGALGELRRRGEDEGGQGEDGSGGDRFQEGVTDSEMHQNRAEH